MKAFLKIALLLFAAGTANQSFAQSSSSPRTLLELISSIEQTSDMRFLYREALVSNINVAVSYDSPTLYEDLRTQLLEFNIGLQVNPERNQALLFRTERKDNIKEIIISGFVIDAKTGDRLPYSTISWFENGEITGVASSTSGTFSARINSSGSTIPLLFSFVGYESKRVDINISSQSELSDIAVRLQPKLYGGSEIIVNGNALYTPSDSVFSSLIEAGSFSPLGDNNSSKALQSLPSVLTGPAINDGLNVRGSSSDGFRVLLDGITLYNQSHLFGLLDGLNGDVLRTSGFFYDITPAQFRAPLGGTLAFLTKTGNLQNFETTVGLSNTAFSTTLEGPVVLGKSSFLFSGRHSYIDEVNWFNNQGIIRYGLDIDRNFDFQSDTVRKFADRNVQNIDGNAFFYDLHGKLYFETTSGSQLVASMYLGKDEANQSYDRRFQQQSEEFETINEWSSKMFRLAYNTQFKNDLYSESSLGFSDYYSNYLKEDNDFRRSENDNNNQGGTIEILPFNLENELQEFQINQRYSKIFEHFDLDFGATYSDFEVLYTEISPRNQSFRSRRTSQLLDLFSQFDFANSTHAHVSLGGRLYYFSNGKYLKWSPRIKAQFLPESSVSFGLGFSKNYQFLHQLDFLTVNSTDFWVMTNNEQPPSSVNYFTSNIRVRPSNTLFFQIEAYYKLFDNLRIHSLSNQFISSFFDEDDTNPFLFNNKGLGKGIEFLLKNRFNKLSLSTTYTLASTELENLVINDGKPFHPSYDRTHQFAIIGDLDLVNGLSLYTSWHYATGTPNTLLSRDEQTEQRIGDYSRLDMSVKYIVLVNSYEKAEFLFSIYNVLNKQNPWYSEFKAGRNNKTNRIVPGLSTVYDLEIQPSFRVKLFF
ncbi:MAG: carboxypeptidase-like regulatory domain-containing protein [Balneola sp.]